MPKLPYIEPTIRSIAGGLVTLFGVLLYLRPDFAWLWFALLFFVSLNLFQSGITRFCLMEKILKKIGFRSEMDEIINLGEIQADYLDTLNLLNEVVIEIGPNGNLLKVSDRWCKMLGTSDASSGTYAGYPLAKYVYPEDRETLDWHLKNIQEGEINNHSFRMQREDGAEHWVEGTFTPFVKAVGQLPTLRGVLRDVTESHTQQKRISHMAMHDALTNLPNRIALEQQMEHLLAQAHRDHSKVAVLFVDLDNFKQINDVYGHKAGDQILVAISAALQEHIRTSDILARWGGDEFVMLLPGLQQMEDARLLADKIREKVQPQLRLSNTNALVTLSIGVAVYPDDAGTSEALLIQADKALFYAKSQGRNNVQLYSEMRDSVLGYKDVDVTSRFAEAVKQGQIQVYYQSQVDAHTRKIIGYEALARWHDEVLGWIGPTTFIPLAENMGLMCELGAHVIALALSQFKQLLLVNPHLYLSVNISNRQLFSKNFVENLQKLLEENEIKPTQLRLEITESISLIGVANAKECLQRLSGCGFYLSMDDFGTGFSSLSLLHDLPVSELKIDISFVRRLNTLDGEVMVRTIIEMGRAMNLTLVAEGVESEEAAVLLRDMGVLILQGYYFSEPHPVSECVAYMQQLSLFELAEVNSAIVTVGPAAFKH